METYTVQNIFHYDAIIRNQVIKGFCVGYLFKQCV